MIATLDQEAIQSQITLLEKSVANANALSQNQIQQNKNALDTAKKDRQAQLSQAKKQIESANSEYTDVQNTYNSLKKQLDALKEQKKISTCRFQGFSHRCLRHPQQSKQQNQL